MRQWLPAVAAPTHSALALKPHAPHARRRRSRGLLHRMRQRLLAIASDRDTLRDQMLELPADGDPNAYAISIAQVGRGVANGGGGLRWRGLARARRSDKHGLALRVRLALAGFATHAASVC